MALDLSHPALHLIALEQTHHLLQVPVGTALPADLLNQLTITPPPAGTLYSLSTTSAEISLIVPTSTYESLKPSLPAGEATQVEGPWRILRVRGPMELHMTGIMAAITAPLKEASVAIFAISTWNTDYVLVHAEDKEKAVQALTGAGWVFDDE